MKQENLNLIFKKSNDQVFNINRNLFLNYLIEIFPLNKNLLKIYKENFINEISEIDQNKIKEKLIEISKNKTNFIEFFYVFSSHEKIFNENIKFIKKIIKRLLNLNLNNKNYNLMKIFIDIINETPLDFILNNKLKKIILELQKNFPFYFLPFFIKLSSQRIFYLKKYLLKKTFKKYIKFNKNIENNKNLNFNIKILLKNIEKNNILYP